MEKDQIIFISNGYGEDLIGAEIASLLQKRYPCTITAVPFVGTGQPYSNKGIPIRSTVKDLPSGGFIWRRPKAFFQDLRGGWPNLLLEKILILKKMAPQAKLIVGIGDKVILFLNSWFIKKPLVFVGVAYSAHYVQGKRVYTYLTRKIMKKRAPLVYIRDELSASLLREKGIKQAVFVGNPMMDCFDITGEGFGFKDSEKVIGILPGSRQGACQNLFLILSGIELLAKDPSIVTPGFVMALANSIQIYDLAKNLPPCWELKTSSIDETEQGVIASLLKNRLEVQIARGLFGDVIHRSTVILGLAGTANEQAAGLGKPIISFPGYGHQATPPFLDAQQRLLGEVVSIVEGTEEGIASKMKELLLDDTLRKQLGEIGRKRMGDRGGIERIVHGIIQFLSNGNRD